jgi:nucleoside-diphosphate-sugar epimerase
MSRVIVAGCGFVGLETARRFQAAGCDVLGLTHSAESAARLTASGLPARAVDISSASSLAELGSEKGADVVIHSASSNLGGAEAYEAVYVRGCENLLAVLAPKRLIFTSSTSVYPQISGEEVTEETPAEPPRETGRLLRKAEEIVLESGGIVARLAGIYGPGRSVLLRKFFSGEAVIEGEGSRIINQVHRDDIASALQVLATRGEPGLYNVVDSEPMPQVAVYQWLAERFGMPIPPLGPINPNRKRGWTSKRVSNAKLRGLGWEPQYPSFFDAVIKDPRLVELARQSPAEPTSK